MVYDERWISRATTPNAKLLFLRLLRHVVLSIEKRKSGDCLNPVHIYSKMCIFGNFQSLDFSHTCNKNWKICKD